MKTKRLLSVDIFRGLTVFLMILVNSPGSWEYVYSPLQHATWHGCTLTDLVFPGFIFSIGISMAISFSKTSPNSKKQKLLIKISKRAFLIFLIGVCLSGFPFLNTDLETYRVFGVLQRIAISFFIAGIILTYVKDIPKIVFTSISLLILHWSLLYFFGGEHPYSLKGNISSIIDQYVVGKKHLYQGYGTPFDPEGLLGALSSSAHILISYCIGSWFLKFEKKGRQASLKWLSFSIGIMILGLIWSTIFPINKSLWTGSYVLFTTGVFMCVLWFLEILIQHHLILKKFKLFRVFGMNPLASYIFSQAILSVLITPYFNTPYSMVYTQLFSPYFGFYLGSFLIALSFCLLIWILAYALYENNIIVKI